MAERKPAQVLVVGVGNEFRGDDGAGIAVVRRLRNRAYALGIDVAEEQNDPTALIERWRGRRSVVLVDAAEGGRAGALRRFDASKQPLPYGFRGSASTHAVGLDEAIELARALGTLPGRVIVHTVTGGRFEAGDSVSEDVVSALPELTEQVLAEARSLLGSIGKAP